MIESRIGVSRQHGAMEYSQPPTDLDTVRRYRLDRVQQALRERDYAGALLFDPMNTRYATDTTDMQIWCMHNETRYVLVLTDGPCIVFEYGTAFHLVKDVPTVDEVRQTTPFFYYSSGPRMHERAKLWAGEIVSLVREYGGGNRRLALDRVHHLGADLLRAGGLELFDAFELMENARKLKSSGEVALMRHAIQVAETAIQAMRDALTPGITENELFSKLYGTNIALGGEWIETRLLSSGPRTNPWMREASMRPIAEGDLVCFDTDMIGPYGYCCDISRAWICGESPPNDEQRRLHELACEQIAHNMALLAPGVSYKEISQKAWEIPQKYQANRYGVVMHGVGMADEIPSIKHWLDFDARGYDGLIEPGMVLCVESYIGAEGGREGVKLEEQVLITQDGIEQLSSYPLDL